MSTISSVASQAFTSPKQRLLDSISSQVGAGTISSTDQTALDSAVDTIDGSLRSSGASTSSRLDPSALKSRVDDLISQQVSSGALTSDQAATLKQVFAQGPGGKDGESGGTGGVAGAGAPHRGHHHAPPPPDDDSSGTDDTAAGIATSTSGSTSDLLSSFIKQLQDSQSQASGYGANASSGGSKSAGALLLDFEA